VREIHVIQFHRARINPPGRCVRVRNASSIRRAQARDQIERILGRLVSIDQQSQIDELLEGLVESGFERQVVQRGGDQIPNADPAVACQEHPLEDVQERRFAVQLMAQSANRVLNLSSARGSAPIPTDEQERTRLGAPAHMTSSGRVRDPPGLSRAPSALR